jgi:hypothetical protein
MLGLQAFSRVTVTASGRKRRVFWALQFVDRSYISEVQLDNGTETSVPRMDGEWDRVLASGACDIYLS